MDQKNRTGAAAVWFFVIAVPAFCLVLASSPRATAAATPPSLDGTYLFLRESSDYRPARGAEIVLKFIPPDRVTVTATRPGKRSVFETGRYSVHGNRITLKIPGLGRSCRGSPFQRQGEGLTLPILIIDDGSGTSTWRRLDVKPDPLRRAVDAFHQEIRVGASPDAALAKAAAGLRQSPKIKSVAVARKTILVTYRSGRREFFLFVGSSPQKPGRRSGRIAPEGPWSGAARETGRPPDGINVQALVAPPDGPMAPLAWKFKRLLRLEPEPCSRGDAPSCRRALVLAPFDSQPLYASDNPRDKYESFSEGGHNLAAVIGPLRGKAKYEVVVIKDQRVTVAEMYRQLQGCWGLVYFDTHGGIITPSDFLLSTGTMIPASRCVTEAARQKFLDEHLTGLPAKIRRHVLAGVVNGHCFVAVTSGFFKAAGGDLGRALVFINGCETTQTPILRQAIDARVFLGWAADVDVHLAGDVLAPLFDCLSRRTRSGREAWDYAVRYLLKVMTYD
ncbi:MAG: hypothetical protein KJ621_20835, partial [Proteobacteria bacterium]|nr:hypothetical protein [Pseudomonadota bacterium]MBU1742820.1 hypothetical protein [Pseudomonadota bacterium]